MGRSSETWHRKLGARLRRISTNATCAPRKRQGGRVEIPTQPSATNLKGAACSEKLLGQELWLRQSRLAAIDYVAMWCIDVLQGNNKLAATITLY
ncbi:hypothetical protein D3C81_1801130 [compost metagenome]